MATVSIARVRAASMQAAVERVRSLSPRTALVGVLAAAVFLRLWGIAYGLPNAYQPDEPFLVGVAVRMLGDGDLNPHFWDYPTLQMYSLLVLYAARQALAPAIPALQAPGVEYLLGRLLNVAYAAGTLVVVYVVGRRLLDRWAGVAAAALVGSSYLHNLMSHVLKVDVPATFGCALVLAAALLLLERPSYGWYAAAGAAVGFATSAKYPVATVAVVVVAAHVAAWRWRSLRELPRLGVAGLSSVAVFLLASPYVVLDFAGFYRDWYANDVLWAATGHEGAEGDVALTYLRWLFLGQDAPLAWLALLGGAELLRRRPVLAAIVAVFPLIYYGELASLWQVRFHTYLLPTYPFLAVLGAYGVATLVRLAISRGGAATAAAATVLGLALGLQLYSAAEYSALLASGDARDVALEWIVANVPAGARVVREGYTPSLPSDRYRVTELWRAIDQDPAWYRGEKVQYLVLGKLMYGRYFADPARYSEQVERYRRLLADATLVQRVEGPMMGARGGEVDVYQLAP